MKIFKYIIMLFLIVVGTSCDKTDLYAYPSSDSNKTDITAFSLLNEKGENVVIESKIDSETGTITVKATPGTSLNRLVPRAAVLCQKRRLPPPRRFKRCCDRADHGNLHRFFQSGKLHAHSRKPYY